MFNPTITLSYEQRVFLGALDTRAGGTLFSNVDDWMAYIESNGGCREIYRNEDGKPVLYLKRYYLYRDSNRESMIHQFFLGDKGPLHDHPADSWGQILRVGYRERLCRTIINGRTEGEYEVERMPGDWSYRPGSVGTHDNVEGFHKVKLRSPEDAGKVITFFNMEKRNKNSWGFRDNNGSYIPFDQMNKKEGTEEKQSSHDQYSMGWFPKRVA